MAINISHQRIFLCKNNSLKIKEKTIITIVTAESSTVPGIAIVNKQVMNIQKFLFDKLSAFSIRK
jgi:hypothetical protein